MKYKILPLWEPWASLSVFKYKNIETRPKATSWTCEKGAYLILAARKWTWEQSRLCTFNTHIRAALNEITDCVKNGSPYWKNHFHFGYIIGSFEVKECKKIHAIKAEKENENDVIFYEDDSHSYHFIDEPELSFGDYREGRYAWVLQNQRVLKTPIPYKGQQGYYNDFKGNVNDLIFFVNESWPRHNTC